MIRLLPLILLLATPKLAHAVWADAAWPVRRAVDLAWDSDKATGDELALVDLWTAGYHVPSGEHVRVATEGGAFCPSRILMAGPGDRIRVIFQPARGNKRFYVYLGHPKPPPAPRNTDKLPIERGLHMEMRKLKAGPVDTGANLEAAFNSADQPVGQTLIPNLYLGFNPFGDQSGVIVKYSGKLNLPLDGEYTFAISAEKGALFIEGKPIVFAPGVVGDVRHNAKAALKKGRHDFTFFHASKSGDLRVSAVWQVPGNAKWELIPAESFGPFLRGTPGALEENNHPVTADFKIEYLGECFFENHFSHRYRFTAPALRTAGAAWKYEWDFGDGQSATTPAVDHVFLTDGEYPVKLTIKSGLTTDSKTNRIAVTRLYERIDNPPNDRPSAQAPILATYDVSKMPPAWLPWAAYLHVRASQWKELEPVALRLTSITGGIDMNTAFAALAESAAALTAAGRVESAGRIWDGVPADSPLHPNAAKHHAHFLLYRAADFAKALKSLEPHAKANPKDKSLQRLWGQALVLNGRAAEGRKVLGDLGIEGPADRQMALTGALARTIEFYANEKDWEHGDAHWDKWQQQYPGDFLDGYSVLLKVRLMEAAEVPIAAAKLAEAFAKSVPKSSYAPRLLDRASKLLATADPRKSEELRTLLKQKYPEDPLAQ